MYDNDDSMVPNNGSPSPGKTTPSSNPVERLLVHAVKRNARKFLVTKSRQLLKILTLTWCVQKQYYVV
eukprot:13501060-Ditylum_brightwellii.AAC.1